MERTTVPFTVYNDATDDGWKRDVIELLHNVITADQVLDRDRLGHDARRDGPLARRARELISRGS
jgi:hypothetical protein